MSAGQLDSGTLYRELFLNRKVLLKLSKNGIKIRLRIPSAKPIPLTKDLEMQ